MENLNKENFFDEMAYRYPAAVEHFWAWVDEYKKEVGWEKLFNCGLKHYTSTRKHTPKFHDIPFEMQIGIFFRYAKETFRDEDNTLTLEGMKVLLATCFEALENEKNYTNNL